MMLEPSNFVPLNKQVSRLPGFILTSTVVMDGGRLPRFTLRKERIRSKVTEIPKEHDTNVLRLETETEEYRRRDGQTQSLEEKGKRLRKVT